MSTKLILSDEVEKRADQPPKTGLLFITIGIVLLAILFLAPFYLVFVNSLKSYGQVISNAAGLPIPPLFANYMEAWTVTRFPLALFNSFVITIFSILLLIVLGAMAAWRLARADHWGNRFLFLLFVSAMVVPFQSVMIPLMKVSDVLNLFDSRIGIIIIYLGFGMPFTIFLFHGFVKASVPKEIEESSVLDGCSSFQTFFYVVLPMLRPMVATVAILHAFWIWNDFLLPLLVLSDPDKRTIPLAVFSFLGRYNNEWNLALATLSMGMLPIVIFFLLLQRFIIRGVAAGGLKG